MQVKVITICESMFECAVYAIHFGRDDYFGNIADCPLRRHGLASDQILLGILPNGVATTRPHEWRSFPAASLPIHGRSLEVAHEEIRLRWTSLKNGDYIEADVLLGARSPRRPFELVSTILLAEVLTNVSLSADQFNRIVKKWFIADSLDADLVEIEQQGVAPKVLDDIRRIILGTER